MLALKTEKLSDFLRTGSKLFDSIMGDEKKVLVCVKKGNLVYISCQCRGVFRTKSNIYDDFFCANKHPINKIFQIQANSVNKHLFLQSMSFHQISNPIPFCQNPYSCLREGAN